jgi:cytochrome b subunit of formate dehydrogenase
VEKAEYWALIWGTIVMVLTGFALWFDNTVMHWISPELLDTMLVVHYYEAWLAFLAIVVWHMYGVLFNPEVYPMNPSWISGKMPEDMYKHEHGAVKLVEHRHVVRTRVRAEGTTMEGREKVEDSNRRD